MHASAMLTSIRASQRAQVFDLALSTLTFKVIFLPSKVISYLKDFTGVGIWSRFKTLMLHPKKKSLTSDSKAPSMSSTYSSCSKTISADVLPCFKMADTEGESKAYPIFSRSS
jgi:hypothetical protein